MAHQSVAWRLQQLQQLQQLLPVVHLLLVSRRPPVQLQSKAANPQFHRMLQRLSQQPSLALNWSNANTQDLPRQRQRQRLAQQLQHQQQLVAELHPRQLPRPLQVELPKPT